MYAILVFNKIIIVCWGRAVSASSIVSFCIKMHLTVNWLRQSRVPPALFAAELLTQKKKT